MRFRGWENWPAADANAESADIVERSDRGGTWYEVRVGYSYLVDGQCYSGNTADSFSTEAEASDYARAMRVGSFIIHYDPKRKSVSRFFA